MVDRVPSMVTHGNFKQRWCPPAFVARDTSWSPGFAVKLRNLPLASGVVWWTPACLNGLIISSLCGIQFFLYPMIYKKGNYHGCRTIRPHQVVNSTAFLCTGVESCLKIGCMIPSVIDSLTCECHQHLKSRPSWGHYKELDISLVPSAEPLTLFFQPACQWSHLWLAQLKLFSR